MVLCSSPSTGRIRINLQRKGQESPEKPGPRRPTQVPARAKNGRGTQYATSPYELRRIDLQRCFEKYPRQDSNL